MPKFLQLGPSRVPQFPTDQDFCLPPWCLEHVCILPQGIPTLAVDCVECSAALNSWDWSFSCSRGPVSCLSNLWVVCISIKHSPEEEIHCSSKAVIPAHLSPVDHNNWHHKSPLTDFLFSLRAFCMWKWDSSCKCMHCIPCSLLLCSGRSVALGFAGSFPHPGAKQWEFSQSTVQLDSSGMATQSPGRWIKDRKFSF